MTGLLAKDQVRRDRVVPGHEHERRGDGLGAEERQAQLKTLQRSSAQTQQRLTTLERHEARVNDLPASLEPTRRTTEANPAARPGAVPPG